MIELINIIFVFPALLVGLLFGSPSQPNSVSKPSLIEVKGIYLTGYTAGWKARRQELVDLVKATELNAVFW